MPAIAEWPNGKKMKIKIEQQEEEETSKPIKLAIIATMAIIATIKPAATVY